MLNWQPQPLSDGWMEDAQGVTYTFSRHYLDERPDAYEAVYAMVRPLMFGFDMLYIGRALNLRDRLSQHEKLEQARRNGATQLWVHRAGRHQICDYIEAERRLIHRFKPKLNEQHTHREESQWMSDLIAAMTPAPRNALDLGACFTMGAQRP